MAIGQLPHVDVKAIFGALRSASFPAGVTACDLIVDFDESTESYVANVALVLDQDVWNDATLSTYEHARTVAWEALSPLDVIPNLLCRTREEHARLKLSEPAWEPIADVDC